MSSHSMRVEFLRNRPTQPSFVATKWSALRSMIQARRTRNVLRELDGHMLADIGLSRGDAIMEAGRPMWDLRLVSR